MPDINQKLDRFTAKILAEAAAESRRAVRQRYSAPFSFRAYRASWHIIRRRVSASTVTSPR